MPDDFGFDPGFGSDPFGGGGGGNEGLPGFGGGGGGDDWSGRSSPVTLPPWSGGESISAPGGIFGGVAPSGPVSGGDSSGLMNWARGLLGRSENQGAPGQPGGSGFGLADVAKSIIPAAQLGLAGFGVKNTLDAAHLAKGQAGQLNQAQQIQRESAQPLQQFGTQQLQKAGAGQIDPAVQQEIDNLVQAQLVQARQWMAQNKITNSTMMESIERDIMNKAEAMKAKVLGMDKETAINALKAAMGGAGQMANTASREQDTLDRLIGDSNRALAALTGASG